MLSSSEVPILTIGMPVYNDDIFLGQALESLIDQVFTNWLLIISDDNSTDDSAIICQKYADRDSRIIYFRQPVNLGISKNMEFLLNNAESKYFMWAGDDDLWDPHFIAKLVDGLEMNESIVSAFSTFSLIDDSGGFVSGKVNTDYSGSTAYQRIKRFLLNSNDMFGYGVFRRDIIKNVKFPEWWWPNRNTPYNNIYPTLCYYLALGDFVNIYDDPLFFKRVKSIERTNHRIGWEGNFLTETVALVIRKVNLVIFSLGLIIKAREYLAAICLIPLFIRNWILRDVFQQFRLLVNLARSKIYSK